MTQLRRFTCPYIIQLRGGGGPGAGGAGGLAGAWRPKVSTHTLAFIAQSLSARLREFFLV